MNHPHSIHPPGCGCEDCHRPGATVPIDLASEVDIARVLGGRTVNDSGRPLTVVTTTTVGTDGRVTGGADTVVVQCDGRSWSVGAYVLAATSFDPPF